MHAELLSVQESRRLRCLCPIIETSTLSHLCLHSTSPFTPIHEPSQPDRHTSLVLTTGNCIDRLSLAWAIIKFKTQPTRPPSQPARQPASHLGNNLSELNWDPSLSLNWLYLSFHWTECHQNFKEDSSKVSDHIQIKIKMPNPSQEPPASSKAQNEALKDINVPRTFKIKIENQNSNHGCIKDQWPYPNQNLDAKPQQNLQCPPKPKKRT